MSSWTKDTITKLVGRLDLEQKVAQLAGLSLTDLIDRDATGGDIHNLRVVPGRLKSLRPHGVGHFSMASFLGDDPQATASMLDQAQRAARQAAPYGIGALVHNEAVNGFLHASGDQFPTAWGQAATWSPELVRHAAAVSATHFHRMGMHLALSPVMDLARDPRWGRVHETYGEDAELVARMSVAFVTGIQGDGGILATGKHFLGYSASEGGLNQAATLLGPRTLVDEYATPFRRAIAEAGLSVIMDSYNEIDGIPAVANRWLFTDLLRGELGFEGIVVSDYDAIAMLSKTYHTADGPMEAGVQALVAGIDADLPWGENFLYLADAVERGLVDEAVVDRATARVLEIKARVGLIPGFTATLAAPAASPGIETATRVREDLADRGLVLLANDGLLPLVAGVQRILVTGPAADELRIHFGAYTSVAKAEQPIVITALRSGQVDGSGPGEIFTDFFQVRTPGQQGAFEEVTRALHPGMATVTGALRSMDPDIRYADLGSFTGAEGDLDPGTVGAALGDAEIVIAVVGERTGWVGTNTAGEGQTTAVPKLPGNQERLVELLASSGKRVVAVVVSGRPLLLEPIARHCDAVLLAPLLGEEAPRAIAQAVFGRLNPSGKLPSSFPRSVGQVPLYHGHHFGSGYEHPTGVRHGYNDLDTGGPLYAFGHGLSYTTFELHLDDSEPPEVASGSVRIKLVASNTGTHSGETVVQLYARDEQATVVRPVRQLVDFLRISLAPEESMRIEMTVPLERLFYTMADGARMLEAGEITLMAGFSSDDIRCSAALWCPATTSSQGVQADRGAL